MSKRLLAHEVPMCNACISEYTDILTNHMDRDSVSIVMDFIVAVNNDDSL